MLGRDVSRYCRGKLNPVTRHVASLHNRGQILYVSFVKAIILCKYILFILNNKGKARKKGHFSRLLLLLNRLMDNSFQKNN